MLFGKSLAIDDNELEHVASAARQASARSFAEVEFIERLRSGEAEAFDELVTRYSNDIFALLCRMTGDPDEAKDLTQDTFVRALRAIGGFRGESGLKTWLFRIAVNESRNRFRWWKRRRRGQTVSLDQPIGESEALIHDTIAGGGASPEDEALRREREALLQRALLALPDAYRETVILFDIHGLSYEQISQTLEISMGTVKSRIARGREELRRKLKGY
ncbi:MAG: sigma-70 family RNA polymerase sigma factor [Pyrinomonadaceae bacterium]